MNKRFEHLSADIFIFLAVLFWGASWVSGKVTTTSLSAEELAFWRYAISFLSLLPFLLLYKGKKKPSRSSFVPLSGAVVSSLFFNFFFFAGLHAGFAGQGGLVVTTMAPLFTSALSLLFFKTKILKRDVLGLFLGILGGGIMLNIWNVDAQNLLDTGNVYFLLSAVMLALLGVSTEAGLRDTPPLVFSFWIFFMVTLINFTLLLPLHNFSGAFSEGAFFWGNMLFLGIFAGSLATLLYSMGVRQRGAHRAAGYTFTIPLSALFFAWLFLGELPEATTLAGAGCVLCATLLFSSYQKNSQAKEIKAK